MEELICLWGNDVFSEWFYTALLQPRFLSFRSNPDTEVIDSVVMATLAILQQQPGY